MTRILWGQVIAVFALALAGVWGATQWTATALAHQPGLGAPWIVIAGFRIYPPPAFFWWWFSFDAYAPQVFMHGAYIAVSGGFAAIVVAIGMSVWRAREARAAETFGTARWATQREVKAAGLLGDAGVVLGRMGRDYLRHDGPEHVLCYAPTRSGKGVGLVVPTLLTWPASAIVHDIKGENWQLTAGLRSRFGRVLLFDPTNTASAAYNPLLEVRRGEWEVRDVQNVADVLVDPKVRRQIGTGGFDEDVHAGVRAGAAGRIANDPAHGVARRDRSGPDQRLAILKRDVGHLTGCSVHLVQRTFGPRVELDRVEEAIAARLDTCRGIGCADADARVGRFHCRMRRRHRLELAGKRQRRRYRDDLDPCGRRGGHLCQGLTR